MLFNTCTKSVLGSILWTVSTVCLAIEDDGCVSCSCEMFKHPNLEITIPPSYACVATDTHLNW